MVTITVQGNQVGFFDSINNTDDDTTDVDVSATFPEGSSVEVIFPDGVFDDNGNLIVDGDDISIDFIITESNGNVIEVTDIKLDLAPERVGDSFVTSADAVQFTDSDGNEFDSQVIVLTNGTLTPGEEAIIERNTNPDGDTNFNLCFEGTTRIHTARGLVPAREISAGDMVAVGGGRYARVIWATHKRHSIDHMKEGQLPVLIKQGALGPNTPACDTIVSAQHRVVVGADGQLEDSGLDAGIVAAKALTVLPGIRYARGKTDIEWSNFLFERHEVVQANGAWMESLLLGPMAMRSFTRSEKDQIAALFPGMQQADRPLNGPPARRLLKAGQVMRAARKVRQSDAA